jgi:hypothetical protein
MAEFDIDVTELEAMARRLRGISSAGALAFSPIALKYRDLTLREARRIAPVDTGQLRQSIQPKRNEASRASLNAEWEVTAPHASPQEYGFVHYQSGQFIGPQPYVRPALKRYRKPYVEELAAEAKLQFKTLKKVSRPILNSTNTL